MLWKLSLAFALALTGCVSTGAYNQALQSNSKLTQALQECAPSPQQTEAVLELKALTLPYYYAVKDAAENNFRAVVPFTWGEIWVSKDLQTALVNGCYALPEGQLCIAVALTKLGTKNWVIVEPLVPRPPEPKTYSQR